MKEMIRKYEERLKNVSTKMRKLYDTYGEKEVRNLKQYQLLSKEFMIYHDILEDLNEYVKE